MTLDDLEGNEGSLGLYALCLHSASKHALLLFTYLLYPRKFKNK